MFFCIKVQSCYDAYDMRGSICRLKFNFNKIFNVLTRVRQLCFWYVGRFQWHSKMFFSNNVQKKVYFLKIVAKW